MKLYHATKATNKDAAIEVAEKIERVGFTASFDHNYQAEVVCLADKPLTGWGGWQDAWVVVDVPEKIAEKYHSGKYETGQSDDLVYGCRVYAFPEDVINEFSMYATTENEADESPMWEGAE